MSNHSNPVERIEMNAPFISSSTKETPPPEAVRLKSFVIDDKHYLMANHYGGIDLCNKQKPSVESRITIEDARRLAAALFALLSAWDGVPPTAAVNVVDVQREIDLKRAEKILAEAETILPRLKSAVGD